MALTQVQGGMLTGSTNTTTAIQSNGTTAITIDASQNVCINTTNNSNTGSGVEIQAKTGQSGLAINGYSGENVRLALRGVGGGLTGITSNTQIYFAPSNTEAMRLDGSGNLGIGTTGPTARLSVSQSANSTDCANFAVTPSSGVVQGILLQYPNQSPNNSGNAWIRAYDNVNLRWRFDSNGGLENYSGNNVNLSDQREKKDIELAGDYLNKICNIPVKTFLYIDQPDDDQVKTLGVIAQDVKAVAPELVTETNWGTEEEPKMRFAVYSSDVQFALMKAIQELNAKVTALETQLATK
jgi:hypothetical protein